MPQMQGNTLEISLDFQVGPTPAIFSAHAPEQWTVDASSVHVVPQCAFGL